MWLGDFPSKYLCPFSFCPWIPSQMDKVLFCTGGLFLKPKADLTKNTLFFLLSLGMVTSWDAWALKGLRLRLRVILWNLYIFLRSNAFFPLTIWAADRNGTKLFAVQSPWKHLAAQGGEQYGAGCLQTFSVFLLQIQYWEDARWLRSSSILTSPATLWMPGRLARIRVLLFPTLLLSFLLGPCWQDCGWYWTDFIALIL